MLPSSQGGDQLLEVCGINLRNAGKEQAALVLHPSSATITMKVQFNPVEFHQFVSVQQQLHSPQWVTLEFGGIFFG